MCKLGYLSSKSHQLWLERCSWGPSFSSSSGTYSPWAKLAPGGSPTVLPQGLPELKQPILTLDTWLLESSFS